MSLFLSATIYDTIQNFFTILTVWTNVVHTAAGEDNHCPHRYWCGQNVKKILKISLKYRLHLQRQNEILGRGEIFLL